MPARTTPTKSALADLRSEARRVYGPEASVRVTEHGGVVVTDTWGTERLTVVEHTARAAVWEAMGFVVRRDSHQGGR